jgi:protein-S-isoprenylcysteine O-methyltransferase Ste14
MNITAGQIIGFSWLLFAAYWIIAALGAKRPAKRERVGERAGYIIFMLLGFFLLYSGDPRFGALNQRFAPEKPWLDYLGAAMTLAGVLFAIWARYTIGKEWSAEIQIKQGHELIRLGPYAHIRHPIYSGILVALAGTALSINRYRAILGVGFFLAGFVRKARKEEVLLAREFGAAFDDHRRHTGFFLPRFS